MERGLNHRRHQKSKKTTLKIGKRSIYDILCNKRFDLSFKFKVDYIRHHYTYYDGCYEYFHHKNGKPNWRRWELNELVADIVNRKREPSELKEYNKKILAWKKAWKKN